GSLGTLERTGTEIAQKVVTAQKYLAEAESLYNRSSAASGLTRLWKGLPKPEQQQAIVNSRKADLLSIQQDQSRVNDESRRSQARLQGLLRRVEAFQITHGAPSDDVLAKCFAFEQQLKKSEDETELQEHAARDARDALESSLRRWVTALREFGLAENRGETAGDMLSVLQDGYEEA